MDLMDLKPSKIQNDEFQAVVTWIRILYEHPFAASQVSVSHQKELQLNGSNA